MNHDRSFAGRVEDRGARTMAVVGVLGLLATIGVGLLPTDAPSADTAEPSLATRTERPRPSPRSPIATQHLPPPAALGGLIWLPEAGTPPSQPAVGELVDRYPLGGGRPPYIGAARLYADGRLIWNLYYDGPAGHNAYSTGYLEQRLTAEGVELVRSQDSLDLKDPRRLEKWLGPTAWEDGMLRPFIPSGYGICLWLFQARPTSDDGGPPTDHLVGLLPEPVCRHLRDLETVRMLDLEMDCLAVSTDEARMIERSASDAGFGQDPFMNRFIVQYSHSLPGTGGLQVWLTFEPRFPDGSISCSSCG